MAYRRSALMQERLADNRQRIIRAARLCIAEGGFHGAQMADIARHAELAIGSIYRYFPSKAELFAQVLDAGASVEVALLQKIAAGPGSAVERLREAVACFVRRALDAPHLAHAFIAEPVEPVVDEVRRRQRQALADAFRRIIDDGIADASLPAQDAGLAAACVVGAFNEALIGPTASVAAEPGERQRVIDAICDFCQRAVQA